MSTFKFLQFDISAEYKFTAICTMGKCRVDLIWTGGTESLSLSLSLSHTHTHTHTHRWHDPKIQYRYRTWFWANSILEVYAHITFTPVSFFFWQVALCDIL